MPEFISGLCSFFNIEKAETLLFVIGVSKNKRVDQFAPFSTYVYAGGITMRPILNNFGMTLTKCIEER